MAITFHSNHSTLNKAFRIAMGDLYSSIIAHQSGVLQEPQSMIMAGLDYESQWTRDAAINSWNAGSLFFPDVAKNTLLGTLEEVKGRVRIGGQYWDQIIWVIGAWNHYLVTGDQEFLKKSFEAAVLSFDRLDQEEFDSKRGLYRGAACFQDGVAGYPDRYARNQGSSDIRDWVRANPKDRHVKGFGLPMFACSTNILYYASLQYTARMAKLLGIKTESFYRKKSEALKTAILKNFWNIKTKQLRYLVDQWGGCERQEGLGSSFAILLGLLTPSQIQQVLEKQHITPHGIPCVWPTYERYRTEDGFGYGRHSGTVWPHVQGFWAEAAAKNGRPDMLMHELFSLGAKAVRDAQFTEIYHPVTGEIYGGLQESAQDGHIHLWDSCKRQTWSATAYLRMILLGVFGMEFTEKGLTFSPCIIDPLKQAELSGLVYRKTPLSVQVHGSGSKIKEIRVNGVKKQSVILDGKSTASVRLEISLG